MTHEAVSSISQDDHSGYVSSTGSLGLEARGDNRLYWNLPRYVTDVDFVSRAFDRLVQVSNLRDERSIDTDPNGRRDVMRFIGSPGVVREILTEENSLSQNIEVIAPISADEWYVMLARNGDRRRSGMSLETMIENTSNAHQKIRHPMEAIRRVTTEGLSFRKDLADPQTRRDVYELWQTPFGWTAEQVDNLADRLASKEDTDSIPNVWFSSLETDNKQSPNGKTVVGAAMAEKITFKGKDGKEIDIIELTEWSVEQGYRGNGYMAATVAQLTSQVLEDYWSRGKETPFIIAECNIQAGAYRSGFSAGLRVPERTIFEREVPQILQQNVTVDDGVASAGLRDFAFMYLPASTLNTYYTKEDVSLAA